MDGGERYHEFDPPEALRPWVRKVWTYACANPSRTIQRIAPDGCPELILDLGDPYEEADADGAFHLQSRALFAGQMTRPIAIRPPPAGDPEAQARQMIDWMDGQRRDDWSIDPLVRAEIEALHAEQPSPPRDGSARRALQRRFLDRVGIAPRTLRAVVRFRRVFDHAMSDEAEGWLSAGLDAGYFDQPQLAREFRRFLGCTATEWAREQVELARAIASQTYKPGGPEPS